MKHLFCTIVLFCSIVSLRAQVYSGNQNPSSKISSYNAQCACVNVTNPGAFRVGDRVLIIQMQGASLSLDNSENFGYPQVPASSGYFEFNSVAAIDGATISLSYSLQHSFDMQNGSVQLVKVLNGTDLNVAQLSCAKWDGNSGGVIVIEATNSVTLFGPIDASACGFRGGLSVAGSYQCGIHDVYLPATSTDGAIKGEGISINSLGLRARGAWANGGGGGNNHNAGGGGGSLAAAGGFGGFAWGNCAIRNDAQTRGIGGFALSVSSVDPRAYLGGGGGAGHRNDNNPSAGANGGGIIIIVAKTLNANNSSIISRGADAQRCEMDGAGGGGAGGSVALICENFLSSCVVDISGGNGGDARNPHGPGGGGSGGVLMLSQNQIPSGLQLRAQGGKSGMNYELGAAAQSFIVNAYGATAGQDGVVLSSVRQPQSGTPVNRMTLNLGARRTVCSGTSEQLRANLQGGVAPFSYSWYPVSVVSSSTIENPVFTSSESSMVSCTVRDSRGCVSVDSVYIQVAPSIGILMKDTVRACAGNVVTLDAQVFGGSGDVVTQWSPATGLSSTHGLQVLARPSASCTYVLSVQDRNGCIAVDSVRINIGVEQELAVKGDRIVCAGTEHEYTTGLPSGVQLLWSATGCLSLNIDHARNSARVVWGYGQSGSLSVSGDARECVGMQSIAVEIEAVPTPKLQEKTVTMCEGDSLVLDAGDFAKFSWTSGETSRRIVVRSAGTYGVNVWNSQGCESELIKQTVLVAERPHPIIRQTVVSSNPCVADEIELEAGEWSSYQWSTGDRSRRIRVRTAGEYSVTVTNASGCSAQSDVVNLQLGADRRPALTGATDVCAHSVAVYRADGLATSYFSWNVDGAEEVTYMGSRNDSVRVQWYSKSDKGTVKLSENTAAGCTVERVMNINITRIPTPSVVVDKTDIVDGDVAQLRATAGYTAYLWSTGETSPSIFVRTSSKVWVVVANVKGCTQSSDTVQIRVHALDEAKVLASRRSACEGERITLKASSTVGSILWSTGEKSSQISVNHSGLYFYTVSNGSKTQVSDSVQIEFFAGSPAQVRREGSMLVANEAAAFQWFQNGIAIAGATSQRYQPTCDARFSVVVANVHGCTSASEAYMFHKVLRYSLGVGSVHAAAGVQTQIPISVHFTDAAPLSTPTRVDFKLYASAQMVHVPDNTLNTSVEGDKLVMSFSLALTQSTEIVVPCELLLSDSVRSSLHLEMVSTSDSSEVLIQDGFVELLGQCGRSSAQRVSTSEALRISAVYPNPSTEDVTIDYSLCESGHSSLRVFDLNGQLRAELFNGLRERGNYSVHLDTSVFPSAEYILVLESPSRHTTSTMNVAH